MLGWAGPLPQARQVVELIPSKLRGGAGFREAGPHLGTLWKHLWQLQEDRPCHLGWRRQGGVRSCYGPDRRTRHLVG